jgi:serine/threonine-protein kinase SRPK3
MLRTDCYGGPHDIFEKEALLRISEVSEKISHEGSN